MAVTIKASQISALGATQQEFEAAVKSHAREMVWHRDHHADASREPYPPPATHPLIDSCVRTPDLVPDYAVEDDLTPTLDQRKSALVHALTLLEIDAVANAWPQRKRRLDAILYAEAVSKIEVIQDEKGNRVGRNMDALSDEEKAVVSDYEGRMQRVAEIEKQSARAQADIEDLTADTIGSWSQPKFQ